MDVTDGSTTPPLANSAMPYVSLGRWLEKRSVASKFLMLKLMPAAFAFSLSSASVVSRRALPATLLYWMVRSLPPFWQNPPLETFEQS